MMHATIFSSEFQKTEKFPITEYNNLPSTQIYMITDTLSYI